MPCDDGGGSFMPSVQSMYGGRNTIARKAKDFIRIGPDPREDSIRRDQRKRRTAYPTPEEALLMQEEDERGLLPLYSVRSQEGIDEEEDESGFDECGDDPVCYVGDKTYINGQKIIYKFPSRPPATQPGQFDCGCGAVVNFDAQFPSYPYPGVIHGECSASGELSINIRWKLDCVRCQDNIYNHFGHENGVAPGDRSSVFIPNDLLRRIQVPGVPLRGAPYAARHLEFTQQKPGLYPQLPFNGRTRIDSLKKPLNGMLAVHPQVLSRMDGPFDELRKKAMTFAANFRGRSAEPNDFLPVFELNIKDVLPPWEQPQNLIASHSSRPDETGEQTYGRLHKSRNVFDRAAAAPTQHMLDQQRISFFLSANPEETKEQMIVEAEAVADKCRAQAQDANKTFVPHFNKTSLIPKHESKAEKSRKDKVYQSGRQLRPEHQEPGEEHLPRPGAATVPTFKTQHPCRSPFCPEMDAPDVQHTSVQDVGMGHGRPVGSGTFMTHRKLDPNFDPLHPKYSDPLCQGPLAEVSKTPDAFHAEERKQRLAHFHARLAGDGRFASIVPENIPVPQTPCRENPGSFSASTPHLAQAGRFRSNLAAIDGNVDVMNIIGSPQRKRQISFTIHRTTKRRKSNGTARVPPNDFGRCRSVSFDDDSDPASTMTPRITLSRRAASRASTIAHLMHIPKLALQAATTANTEPKPSYKRTQKVPMRKRVATAAQHAKDVLQLRTEIFIHGRRRISDLERDNYGNNYARVTKKERAGKKWDPAKVGYYLPTMTWPPTPGRPASKFVRTPEHKKKAIMRKDPKAAPDRLQAGWHPQHDLKFSGTTQEDAVREFNERNLDLVMTDRAKGAKVTNASQAGQNTQDTAMTDADNDTEDEDNEDGDPEVEDHLKEAAHNTQLHQLQEPASNHEEVLHRDPIDAFGEHPSYKKRAASAKRRRSSARRRSASSRRCSESSKSKGSTHSIKGMFSYAKNKFRHSSPHGKKPRKASDKGTRYDDEMANSGGAFRVGRVEKLESVTVMVPIDSPQRSPTRATIGGERPDIRTSATPSHSRIVSAPAILKTTKNLRESGSGPSNKTQRQGIAGSPSPAPRPRRPTVAFQAAWIQQDYRLDEPTATIGHTPVCHVSGPPTPRPNFLPLDPAIERPPARHPTFLPFDPVIERPQTRRPNFLPLDLVVGRPFTPVQRPHTPPLLHPEGHHAYPYEMLPPPNHSYGSGSNGASRRATELRPFSFQSGTPSVGVIEQPEANKLKDAALQDGFQAEDTYINRGRGAYSGEYMAADAIRNPPLRLSRTDEDGPEPQTTAHRALLRTGLLATSRPLPPLNRRRRRQPRNRSDTVLFRPTFSQMDGCGDGRVEANAESEDGVEEPPKKRPKLGSSSEEAPSAPQEGIAKPPGERKRTPSTTGVASAAGPPRTTVASRMLADPTVRDDEIVDRLLRERDRLDAASIAERLRRRADVATWVESEADDEKAGLSLAPPDPPLAISEPSAYTFSSSQFPTGDVQAMYEGGAGEGADEGWNAAEDRTGWG